MLFSVENLVPAFASTKFSAHGHLFLSVLCVNTKTGSGVRFNRHIDSDVCGFTRQTSSLQTHNSNAQNCHNQTTPTCFTIPLPRACPGSNHNYVYVILIGPQL
jgi:hypothetical protein